MAKIKAVFENKENIKETFDVLKVFRNGTGLAVNIPASFIKKSGIRAGDPLSVTFEASKINLNEEVYLKLAKLYQRMCKHDAAFENVNIHSFFNVIILWLIESADPKGVDGKPRKVAELINEANGKYAGVSDYNRDLLKCVDLINKDPVFFYKAVEESWK